MAICKEVIILISKLAQYALEKRRKASGEIKA
jgi:hypothetical protein